MAHVRQQLVPARCNLLVRLPREQSGQAEPRSGLGSDLAGSLISIGRSTKIRKLAAGSLNAQGFAET
jgi:hypothetical protein